MTADEEKISSLYQQGKDQQPPAHLDSVILKKAREAVAVSSKDGSAIASPPIADPAIDSPATVKSPFSGGWPAITSIAAVLIVTVILVPLINKATPPPETSHFANDTQQRMQQQDSFSTMNSAKENRDDKLQVKKRSQADAPVLLREEDQLLQAPQEAVSPDVLNAGKAEQITGEESMTTMGEAVKAPVAARSAKPASAMMKSAIMDNDEDKLEVETIPQFSSGILADKDLPEIMTASEWLKKIRQLIDQGELNLAKQELGEFNKYYPDEEIDPLLANQLKDQ